MSVKRKFFSAGFFSFTKGNHKNDFFKLCSLYKSRFVFRLIFQLFALAKKSLSEKTEVVKKGGGGRGLSFYSTPSTEGVESTRGNSVCLWVCGFVCPSSLFPSSNIQ